MNAAYLKHIEDKLKWCEKVTPQYYWNHLHIKDDGFNSLDDVIKASKDNGKCQCGMPVWRLAQTGLCFYCTTGESDRSEDYELVPPHI